MNGAKGNRSANTTCLNCFCGTKKHLLAICSKNSGNKGNISNKCKKNPTPTLSKSGWEHGAGDRTRRPSGTGTRCARPSPGPLLVMDQRHKQQRHPEWGAFAVGAGDRTRTGTLSPAVDFEWLRHVCPPQFSAVLRRRKPLRQQAFLQ